MSRPGPRRILVDDRSKRMTITARNFFSPNGRQFVRSLPGSRQKPSLSRNPAGPPVADYYDVRVSAVVWRDGSSASDPMKSSSVMNARYPVAGR
jgi:hypothetical protein